MQRNGDDEKETFMRQRNPPSAFNPRPHMLFRHPRTLIRLETRRNGRVALVFPAGLAKAAQVRHLGMQRGGGRRDPKLSG